VYTAVHYSFSAIARFQDCVDYLLYLLQSLMNMHLPRPKVTDKLRNASYFVIKYVFQQNAVPKISSWTVKTPTAVGRVKVWTGKWSCNRRLGVGRVAKSV
jgi:hypothetical protein